MVWQREQQFEVRATTFLTLVVRSRLTPCSLLAGVQTLNSQRDEWSLGSLITFEDDEELYLTSTAQDSGNLYSSTKADILNQISNLTDNDDLVESQSKAENELNLTAKAYNNWRAERRSTRSRKAAAGLQVTLNCVAKFLEGFSGIAEIVKAADQQYGGLAYGTLSLLLNVAVNKQRREEAIEEALEELGSAFPRLETLKTVRKKDVILSLVVEVFELSVVFCRDAIEYYANGRRRLARAFASKEPDMPGLLRLRMKLNEIRKECEVMMLEELADVKRELQKVQVQLRQIQGTGNDTNSRVRDGQDQLQKSESRAREDYLLSLKQLLGLKRADEQSPDGIARYKSVLENALSEGRWRQKKPRQMSWAILTAERAFTTWLERPESSMLLLSGSNLVDDSSVPFSWLSYASILIVQSTLRPLYFFCQTKDLGTSQHRPLFSDVIRSLILQLAKLHPDSLRCSREDITDTLLSEDWQSNDCAVAFATMTHLLIRLLNVFEEGSQFTFVIDRLDQCSWTNATNQIDKAIAALLDIAQAPSLHHLKVKILLVIGEDPAQSTRKTIDWERRRGLEWKRGWDQEMDSDCDD